MKVCMIAYTFYETDNRVRRYAETCARKGHEVDVIALRRGGEKLNDVINDVTVYRIQKRSLNEQKKLTYLFKILSFLINSFTFLCILHARKHYDLIHVHSVPDFEVFSALLPKLTGSKIILDIHDIVPEFYASKFNAREDSIIFKSLVTLERMSIAFSDHVIIANDLWRDTLVSRSVKDEKCTTILNYPDPFIFYRRRQQRNDDKFIMLYPGSLGWHQGLDVAIKAMAIIKEKAPEAEFHIYGGGQNEEKLRAFIFELKVSDKVFFHPSQSIDKIASVMAEADLAVVPKRSDSFGNEAFSTKILEFMALGVPVIVADTKVDKFYFDDSLVRFFKSGDEKDLAETMLLLIRNKDLRGRLVLRGLEYIKKNNWGCKEDMYLNLVKSLGNAR